MSSYADQIKNYYNNARLFIKQGNAKDARLYVLAFVNIAYDIFKQQKGLMERAKTQAFLMKWVRVAQTLREKGIDDFVLCCFGLEAAQPAKSVKSSDKAATVSAPANESGATAPKIKIDDFMAPARKYKPVEDAPKPEGKGGERKISADDFLSDAESQGWAADVFEKRSPSIVSLKCSGGSYSSEGTGFIISANGYLLTNDHVVYDESAGGYFNKITMTFSGGKKEYKATVVTSSKARDLALCRFEPDQIPDIKPIPFIDDYSRLKQGADVLVIGNGLSMGLAPFTGTVKYTCNDRGDLVYTAPSNPGDSGGPVFNRAGECVGINKSVTVSLIRGGEKIPANGLTNATPADKIAELLEKWSKNFSINF